MKIIMTLLVRDEEDILRENIDFHLNQGVDFIIATDNLSVDSTKDILKDYEKQGVLHYIYEKEDNYNQRVWVTRMARLAATKYNADWVINNDADEFWWPCRHRNLKEAFSSLPDDYNIVQADRNNFVYLDYLDDKKPFYQQMLYKEYQSLNPIGKPLPPKQAHKADSNIIVSPGNHCVGGLSNLKIKHNVIEIFHFPIRTQEQFTNKIKMGGAAYQRNNHLPENVGWTWRNLYNNFKKNGNLDDYLEDNIYNRERLKQGLDNKIIVKDERLSACLRAIYVEN